MPHHSAVRTWDSTIYPFCKQGRSEGADPGGRVYEQAGQNGELGVALRLPGHLPQRGKGLLISLAAALCTADAGVRQLHE